MQIPEMKNDEIKNNNNSVDQVNLRQEEPPNAMEEEKAQQTPPETSSKQETSNEIQDSKDQSSPKTKKAPTSTRRSLQLPRRFFHCLSGLIAGTIYMLLLNLYRAMLTKQLVVK